MSQHTDGVNRPQWFLILQCFAQVLGYCLCIGGWLLFSYIVTCINDPIINPDPSQSLKEMDSYYRDCGVAFSMVGCLLVPGWLLLRFAAGLFPFGRRVFK